MPDCLGNGLLPGSQWGAVYGSNIAYDCEPSRWHAGTQAHFVCSQICCPGTLQEAVSNLLRSPKYSFLQIAGLCTKGLRPFQRANIRGTNTWMIVSMVQPFPLNSALKTNFPSSSQAPIFYTSEFSLHLSLCNYFFKKNASKLCMFHLILLTSLTGILLIYLFKKSC